MASSTTTGFAGASVSLPICSASKLAIWPIVRARIRLVGGSATPMALSNIVLDFHAHERVEAEVGERLIFAQAVRLDPQHRADDVAHGFADDGVPIFRRCGLDLGAPVAAATAGFLRFRRRLRKCARRSGLSCMPRNDCRHFAQSTRIAATWVAWAVRKDSISEVTSAGVSAPVP